MSIKFTAEQLKELRTRYAAIDRVDPTGNAYAAIRAFLDKLDQDHLLFLSKAKIKWVSRLALNRVRH